MVQNKTKHIMERKFNDLEKFVAGYTQDKSIYDLGYKVSAAGIVNAPLQLLVENPRGALISLVIGMVLQTAISATIFVVGERELKKRQ